MIWLARLSRLSVEASADCCTFGSIKGSYIIKNYPTDNEMLDLDHL